MSKDYKIKEEDLNALINGIDSLPTNFRHSHIMEIIQFLKAKCVLIEEEKGE